MSQELLHPTVQVIAKRLDESAFRRSNHVDPEITTVRTDYHFNYEGRSNRGDMIAEFIFHRNYDAQWRARELISTAETFTRDLQAAGLPLGGSQTPNEYLRIASRYVRREIDFTRLYPRRKNRKQLRIYEAAFGPMMETLLDSSGWQSSYPGHRIVGPIAVHTYNMTATRWTGSQEGETLPADIFHTLHYTYGPWQLKGKQLVMHGTTGRVWSEQAAITLDLQERETRLGAGLAVALLGKHMLRPYSGGLPQEAS